MASLDGTWGHEGIARLTAMLPDPYTPSKRQDGRVFGALCDVAHACVEHERQGFVRIDLEDQPYLRTTLRAVEIFLPTKR